VKVSDPQNLCLECGFCCNGVLFADVKLQADDNPSRLRSLGVPVSGSRFRQPCSAWEDCRCRIYSDRPRYCRDFECLLLKSLKSSRVDYPIALGLVRSTQAKVEQVRKLLRSLGDKDERSSLRERFLRTSKRLESGRWTKADAALYSELTLAFHDLDQVLRRSFYDE